MKGKIVMAWIDILRRQVGDRPRSRQYLTALDWQVDQLKKVIDVDRGLVVRTADGEMPMGPDDKAGSLPHEKNPDYWELSPEDRAAVTPESAKRIYKLNEGRVGTARLSEAAFCWAQTASRHHGDPELLRFVERGIQYHTGSIRKDGAMGNFGLNGMVWAHGWDIEGVIYALSICHEALDPQTVASAKTNLTRSADHLAKLPGSMLPRSKGAIGTIGNQRCVWLLGMCLYARLLDRPDLDQIAEPFWQDVLPRILDDSGIVVEQYGPCIHYSVTGFIYAWINVLLRGEEQHLPRVLKCAQWFQERFTDSGYPFPGPSARQYVDRPTSSIVDLWPATEQLASLDPSLRVFIDKLATRCTELTLSADHPAQQDPRRLAGRHLGSILMWAALMAEQAPEVSPESSPATSEPVANKSITHLYARSTQHGRMPMPYMYVRRMYQTTFTFADFMPFAGLQTWAWGNEPPIVHPTPLYPSTTIAMGIDTARQGASHNWGLFGAGSMALDVQEHEPDDENKLWVVLARYHMLWRVICFSDDSVVIIELGPKDPRTTRWTINRVEPAAPTIESGMVWFQGRTGCLHTTLAHKPTLETMTGDDPWAKGVQQLVYDCGVGVTAFALSDDAFRFETQPSDGQTLGFSDRSGSYKIKLDPRLFNSNNPGHLRLDPYQLVRGINVSHD